MAISRPCIIELLVTKGLGKTCCGLSIHFILFPTCNNTILVFFIHPGVSSGAWTMQNQLRPVYTIVSSLNISKSADSCYISCGFSRRMKRRVKIEGQF